MGGNNNKKNLELGYQTAISLMTYEGELVWSRFNVMITTHTVLLALIGIGTEKSGNNTFLFIALSIAGILLCLLWLHMTSRGFIFLKYYTLSAREIEDKIRDKNLKILEKGYNVSKNNIVSFDLPIELRNFQRPPYNKLINIRTEWAAYVTILIVIVLYMVLLWMHIAYQ